MSHFVIERFYRACNLISHSYRHKRFCLAFEAPWLVQSIIASSFQLYPERLRFTSSRSLHLSVLYLFQELAFRFPFTNKDENVNSKNQWRRQKQNMHQFFSFLERILNRSLSTSSFTSSQFPFWTASFSVLFHLARAKDNKSCNMYSASHNIHLNCV